MARRISVFDAQGAYLTTFGYGVRDGSDVMQVCGLEIGPCRAGVSYVTDSRSYFTRLDFGPEGELFAYMPLTGQIRSSRSPAALGSRIRRRRRAAAARRPASSGCGSAPTPSGFTRARKPR